MSWMTQADAAAVLGCSIRTIRRRIRSSSLTARRDGRKVLVKLDLGDPITEAPLARRLPEDARTSPVQLPSERADTLAGLSAAVKDNLSVLSECRQQLEANTKRMKRIGRAGWLLALASLVALGAVGWFDYRGALENAANLHHAQRTFAGSEAEFKQALATARGRHKGEADALWISLTHERLRAENAEQGNAGLIKELATVAAQRDRLLVDSERLEAERDALATDLRQTEKYASVAKTLNAIWAAVKTAVGNWPSIDELHRLREETRTDRTRHQLALAAAYAQYQADLAAASGRYEGELRAVKDSLDHERQTVAQLERRIETLADKLVAVGSDRGRLRLGQVRLQAEIDTLKASLEQATSTPALVAAPEREQ